MGLATPSAGAAGGKGPVPAPGRLIGLKTGAVDAANPGRSEPLLASGVRGLYVVQFRDVITVDTWKTMTQAGAEVDTYLPDFAFLVRMTAEQARNLGSSDLVSAVTRFRPEWKVAPGLTASKEATVRITTFAGEEAGVAARLGGHATYTGPRTVVTHMNRSAIAALARSEQVTFIDEVRPHALANDLAAGLIGVSSAGGAWTSGLTGTGQVVAVVDTGLDTGSTTTLHPDLRDRLQITPLALGRSGNWSDPDGHGTHVAGSVVGNGSASAGQYKGMAPGAKLVFQSVLDAQGGLGGIPADLGTLFSQAAASGARIHTNSWGVPLSAGGWVYDAEAQQVDQYTWSNKGATVLFAAGNDGRSATGTTVYNSVTTPSTAKNAITVGASESNRPAQGSYADNPNTIASFSSRGNTPDGRVKPDVVSPGTWIISTRSALAPSSNYWGVVNSSYAYDSGTSMATPITAGATALVRQYYTDVRAVTPAASLIKATLINGATDLGYGWMSPDQGWGRVNLVDSLYPTGGRVNWYENEANSLGTGASQSHTFSVSGGGLLKFTLVWTDYPGAVQAAKELVNDLDLQVTGPDGSVYKGNCFAANTAATSCASFDRSNNVENVYFAALTAGTYTARVSGYNVPNGPQPYSLVVSGVGLVTGSGARDTQAPTTSITAPADGATVSGTVTVSAIVTDNVGVSRVEFYLDGGLQSTGTATPFNWSWNTGSAVNGAHTLTAKAYDAAGNVGTSVAVAVTVSNAASATANEMFTGSLSSGSSKSYYIDVTVPGAVNISLNWPTTATDLDLYLYNPSGTQVGSSAGLANPEATSYTATTTGRYRIKVLAYSGSSAYTVQASQPINPAVTATVAQSGSLATGTQQTYGLTVGTKGSLDLKLDFPAGADFDLYLSNAGGTTVASATSATLRPETVSYAVSGAGSYTIRVVAYAGSGAYTLTGYAPK